MLSKIIKFGLIGYTLLIPALFVDSFFDTDIKADYAIVLGNKVELNGTPSPRLAARLAAALQLYKQGNVNKIIVSGGVGKEGHDEAKVMAKYFAAKGVPTSDIVIDSQGYNTHQTSQFANNYIKDKMVSVIAVSQQYHISRAKLSLRNAGFKNVYGYYPKHYELRDIYAYTREIPAWAKYWFFSL